MTTILTNNEIESIIENVGSIIKNKISNRELIKKELEDTNISILNLPIVKKIIYAYEEEKNVSTNQTDNFSKKFLNENILLDKISYLEHTIKDLYQITIQMKIEFNNKIDILQQQIDTEEHIKLQIEEKDLYTEAEVNPDILFNFKSC
jgi:hypothetical protein